MTLSERIDAFSALGKFLSQFEGEQINLMNKLPENIALVEKFEQITKLAQHKNGWFTPQQIQFAIKQWSCALTKENLSNWLSEYSIKDNTTPKTIAIVMAGNIPLVGFHDLLCVLITGNKALVKLSSNDTLLTSFLCEYLISINKNFSDLISITKDKLTKSDAIIATGSNNTARYFEYYFKDKPHIIRKNRNSVAVLTGNETNKELEALGEDIFRYFGMGCRSVSKLFVPKNYDFDNFFKAIYKFKNIIDLEKYANNYDYNKAVYLMSEFKILDNGFFTIKEDNSYSSPISSLFYEYYDEISALENKLLTDNEKLQCVVNFPQNTKNVEFGNTQKPKLNDFADNINTINFLLKI